MKRLLTIVLSLAMVSGVAFADGPISFPAGGGGGSSLPSQTGNSGKYLTTDGSSASWDNPAGSGDVTGGATSVSNEMATYNGTGGKTIQRSLFVLAGPSATAKTYTFPNSNATIWTNLDNGVVGPVGGSTDTYFAYWDGATGRLLKDGQSSVNPAFSTINVYGANALNLGTAGTYAGQIRYKSAGHASNYFPIIANGTFTDNVGWTLPATGASGGSGYLLTVGNTGVMGYAAPPGTLAALAAGTMTDTKYCIYTASGNQVVCNTTPAGSGDVSGGSTSVDGELAAYNSTGGKTIKQSFFKPSGPASSVKTYTFPNASATVLTDNAAVTIAQGGTNAATAADARTNLGLGTISTLTAGTMTDTKACIYTASGTQIVCNTTIAGGGDFSGPASSTDNAVVLFDGTGGKTGKNSGITLGADNTLTIPGGISTGAGTDGQRRLTFGNNTAIAPTASTNEIYFEGNILKVNEDGTERTVAKTDGNVATATALAADPANCSAGQIALGVTAAGVAECTATPSGLTSVGATTFTGALTGNASTATTASNVAVGSDANGDILVRGASAYGRLAAVAAGQPLLSGGASTAPAYAGYTFSATAAQTYTFPATSKTLMATDGNTSGTAANVSGTPALPNGTTATRQAADDTTDKLATDNWVITQAYAKINRTKTFSFAIDNVISTDNVLMWRVPVAVTLTRADCYATVDNVIGSLMECSTSNVTSCTVLDSWTVTNAVNPFTDSSMTDGAVAAGAWVRWSTTSVGTASMNRLSCTIQYNE